jgi:hypothetical protein
MSKRITDRAVLDVLEAARNAPVTPDPALAHRYGARTVLVIMRQLADRGLLELTGAFNQAVLTARGLAVLAAQRPGA